LKIKLNGLHSADVAETQEAVTDELKFQNEKLLTAFLKLNDRTKAYIYMPMEHILNKKRRVCFTQVSSIFKNISSKPFR
jgi:hypothetical protein